MNAYIICNWKTYITTEEEAIKLAEEMEKSSATVVICPSALHIPAVIPRIKEKGIALGAQDISVSRETPQTGRLSGKQISAIGIQYVLVGHAETRKNGVTNTMVAEKADHAYTANLTPVICLSEQEKNEKKEGDEVTTQLNEILAKSGEAVKHSVIAYEPTAYIGADRALSPEKIHNITGRLRETMRKHGCGEVPVLYGGSVNETNIRNIMEQSGVNGFLLGRAGVDKEMLRTILRVVTDI